MCLVLWCDDGAQQEERAAGQSTSLRVASYNDRPAVFSQCKKRVQQPHRGDRGVLGTPGDEADLRSRTCDSLSTRFFSFVRNVSSLYHCAGMCRIRPGEVIYPFHKCSVGWMSRP